MKNIIIINVHGDYAIVMDITTQKTSWVRLDSLTIESLGEQK